MGEEADFYFEEADADPRLVAALQGLASPPSQPEMLAKLVEAFAGFDLAAGAFGIKERTREVRRQLLPKLRIMQKAAREAARLDAEPNLDIVELALRSLLPESKIKADPALARRAADAIALLSELPLRKGASGPGGRPPLDEVAAAVVLAVGTYFARQKIPFSGEPRVQEIDGRRQHEVLSEQAQLTFDVLKILKLPVTLAELGTLMPQAQAKLAAKNPH